MQAINSRLIFVTGGGSAASAVSKTNKDEGTKELTSALQANRPPISRVKPGKAPTTHAERVEELLRAGWRYDDILQALEASKDEGGDENLEAAQDYLENLRQWRLQNINGRNASKAVEGKEEGQDKIAEGTELALYIAVKPDHIDVCLHLLSVHEMNTRSHNADHFRTAANLMAKVQQEAITSKIPPFALKKIALAVVNDCEKCADLRAKEAIKKDKERDAEERTARRAREAELKAEQEAAKAKKEAEEKLKAEEKLRRHARTLPLPDSDIFFSEDPFDPKDSAWLTRRRGGVGWECGDGDLRMVGIVDMSIIQHCEVYSHKFHQPCTKWAKVQHETSKCDAK
jgi:hypothetical protein